MATLVGAPKFVPEDEELLEVEPVGELCFRSEKLSSESPGAGIPAGGRPRCSAVDVDAELDELMPTPLDDSKSHADSSGRRMLALADEEQALTTASAVAHNSTAKRGSQVFVGEADIQRQIAGGGRALTGNAPTFVNRGLLLAAEADASLFWWVPGFFFQDRHERL